jgi:alkanesulfonate monooxygenase SsuD/methylene tetrahydromethanopterin reductase-like flavin-dependent oxidoreductase (luciferase family)
MITKFDSSYAGHIDMEDVGYAGIPVNDRFYSNDRLATALSKAEAMAKKMDGLGYSSFWMAEHHFQPEGTECIPNVLMMALHLTHLTKNLRIGCGFNVTPMWHPLRLAEDYAMADILSKGRVIFGVARGYHTREVESFGAPLIDQAANRELFEEQVDIIFKAFNNERFSHKGKHYTLPPDVPYRGYDLKELTLVPRPLRLPVECWQPIQSGSARALDFMARHGIGGVIGGGSAEGGAVHKSMVDFQAAYARIGQHLELGERMALGFQFFIAESREAGMKAAAKYYEENMKLFGELRLVRALSDEQIEAMRHPQKAAHLQAGGVKLPGIEDAVKAGGFLCGTPDDIIGQLKALEARYPGLDRITVSQSIGVPLSVALDQIERFAADVMPAFKAARPAAPALVN